MILASGSSNDRTTTDWLNNFHTHTPVCRSQIMLPIAIIMHWIWNVNVELSRVWDNFFRIETCWSIVKWWENISIKVNKMKEKSLWHQQPINQSTSTSHQLTWTHVKQIDQFQIIIYYLSNNNNVMSLWNRSGILVRAIGSAPQIMRISGYIY